MISKEEKDQKLFNDVGEGYSKKDLYPPTSMARRYQTEVLLNHLASTYGILNVGNVLDIGCGHGATAEYLKPNFINYHGLDYSQTLIDIASLRYGEENIHFTCQNIKQFKEYENYNLILGIGVLHHVEDLINTLVWLKKNCKEGTVFAFNEPQNGNPFIQFLRFIRKIIDKNYSEDQVFFSKKQLRSIFEEAGFKVDKLVYMGYFSIPFAQVMLKPGWIFIHLSRFSIWLDRILHKRMDNRLAWNMLILAS